MVEYTINDDLNCDSVCEPEVEVENERAETTIVKHPFSPSDIKLSTPPMNLGQLIEMIQEGCIKFDPDYQREQNLWSPIQQSRLIESVLLGLRLPAFYFEELGPDNWTIIDGLQRCCAIRNFCVDESMTLEGLEFLGEGFEGKKYSELSFSTKRQIKMLPITVNLLEKGVTPMVKYVLFGRLNSGGVKLTPQEIRNAVFCGPAIDAIREMAHSDDFVRATCNHVETKRKTDMDFVSRFVAFYVSGWENYEPDLETYINGAMTDFKDNWSTQDRLKLVVTFKEIMYLAYELFGNRAFRKQESLTDRRRPLNKAYFEVISVLLAKLDKNQRDFLLVHKELMNTNMCLAMRYSQTYRNSFSGGTGDPSAVKTRFSWMEQIINLTLNNKKIRINDNKIESM